MHDNVDRGFEVGCQTQASHARLQHRVVTGRQHRRRGSIIEAAVVEAASTAEHGTRRGAGGAPARDQRHIRGTGCAPDVPDLDCDKEGLPGEAVAQIEHHEPNNSLGGRLMVVQPLLMILMPSLVTSVNVFYYSVMHPSVQPKMARVQLLNVPR